MPPARKPWPMKWIVLSIAIFIVGYTFLTLRYRKPGPGYYPYEDAQQRASLARAGYARVTLHPEWPSDPPPIRSSPAIQTEPGGLPADLRSAFFTPPLLASAIGPVEAGPDLSATKDYLVRFEASVAGPGLILSEAKLYYRPGRIYLVPSCEPLNGLEARRSASVSSVAIPFRVLPPGRYRFTLVGERDSKAWTVQVH